MATALNSVAASLMPSFSRFARCLASFFGIVPVPEPTYRVRSTLNACATRSMPIFA